MSQPHLLFAGACARVVDENLNADPREPNALRTLPRRDADKMASVPVGGLVQVLDGPRPDKTPKKETTWWAVRVLDGAHQGPAGLDGGDRAGDGVLQPAGGCVPEGVRAKSTLIYLRKETIK